MTPSVLAIIPARANSKRIPGKNKKLFLDKPLIHWTIDAALKSRIITDVVVSTDDEEILQDSEVYKDVHFVRRPKELALDDTPGIAPILHFMESVTQKYDFIVLLQPTSPLRTVDHIDSAFEHLLQSQKKQLVSVKKISDPFAHIVVQKNNRIEFLNKYIPESDQLKPKVLNGALYFSSWQTLMEEKTFFGSQVELFEMDEMSSVDIDTMEDWDKAVQFATRKESK